MKHTKGQYKCKNCSATFFKWCGQCTQCHEWGSVSEDCVAKGNVVTNGRVSSIEKFSGKLLNVDLGIDIPISELSYVLGGKLVKGATILLGGDPGIGKSTLLLQLVLKMAEGGNESLYISGEESVPQMQMRAKRIGVSELVKKAHVIAESSVENIIASADSIPNLSLLILDSVQTLSSSEVLSAAGTSSQVRCSAQKMIDYAKKTGVGVFFVGHVTKDGQIAGPKILEHMVDTVLYFEGEKNSHLRILRSIKNRFGPVNEIGVFEMQQSGLTEVKNPSKVFLTESDSLSSGTSIFVGIEGSRPLLVEIQVLIASSNLPIPKRTCIGWDTNRLSMLIAVLSVRCGVNLNSYDIYLSVAGGLKITEPAADMAVAAALVSAYLCIPLPQQYVWFGEISLSGDVKKVVNVEKRLNEAKKMGFSTVVSNCPLHDALQICYMKHIGEIVKTVKDLSL
ncbi:DNA repair protein RadA [Candidatus Sneabacter namystus]|uniref:DNA repair protein RadA n=1 Tax=Candidatus Sneabacter namystus TaxID=2601646 RepID=A0A5C0UHK6_9RICK|nr:DNA repair protein RadA [Candidatus Sneabacter namystus]QEK39645.1 DNA repair protein RadA [Candidatus Sneabacter namystus]